MTVVVLVLSLCASQGSFLWRMLQPLIAAVWKTLACVPWIGLSSMVRKARRIHACTCNLHDAKSLFGRGRAQRRCPFHEHKRCLLLLR